MTSTTVRGGGHLSGRLRPPGDKSISHRSLMMGLLATGECRIRGLLDSEDVQATQRLVSSLGAALRPADDALVLTPPAAPVEPDDVIDCGNSGTTSRLALGLLAGLPVTATLTGDGSLRGRPMRRVVAPLTSMGARFLGRDGANLLPLTVQGGGLKGQAYQLPVASGQVKGALLLAGLNAEGETVLTGKLEGRDHTERMFRGFGVQLETSPDEIRLEGGQRLQAFEGEVPADPSSAAFFAVAAATRPDSEVRLTGVSRNPGRIGFLRVLEAMGAEVEVIPTGESLGEPLADLVIRAGAGLKGVEWDPAWVVAAIDEVPVLAVAACLAEGRTVLRGAEELRVKETDRLATVTEMLGRLGAEVDEREDGFVIEGPQALTGATVDSHGDHRIAMAAGVAALSAAGTTTIEGADAAAVSYPRFFEDLASLRQP